MSQDEDASSSPFKPEDITNRRQQEMAGALAGDLHLPPNPRDKRVLTTEQQRTIDMAAEVEVDMVIRCNIQTQQNIIQALTTQPDQFAAIVGQNFSKFIWRVEEKLEDNPHVTKDTPKLPNKFRTNPNNPDSPLLKGLLTRAFYNGINRVQIAIDKENHPSGEFVAEALYSLVNFKEDSTLAENKMSLEKFDAVFPSTEGNEPVTFTFSEIQPK